MGLSARQTTIADAYYVTLSTGSSDKNVGDQDVAFSVKVLMPFLQDKDDFLEGEMQMAKCQVKIPVQQGSSAIEVFEDSDFIMTLKRYLSTTHSVKAILELFELAGDNEGTLKCLRLLASIIIQNKDSELLRIFDEVEGYTRLQGLLA